MLDAVHHLQLDLSQKSSRSLTHTQAHVSLRVFKREYAGAASLVKPIQRFLLEPSLPLLPLTVPQMSPPWVAKIGT